MESAKSIMKVLQPKKERKKPKKTEKQLFEKPKNYKNTRTSEMVCPKGMKICKCNKNTPKCVKKSKKKKKIKLSRY